MNAGRALVAEGLNDVAALAACRGLAAAGWTVGAASPQGRGLAATSNAVANRHDLTPPQIDLDAFVEDLNVAVEQGGYEVVFPGGGDAETMALSLRRDAIRAIVPFCAHDQLRRSFDKLKLAEAARHAGLRAPLTAPLDGSIPEEISFPAVVKARLHAPMSADMGPSRIAPTLAMNSQEGLQAERSVRTQGGVPIIQEAVSGKLGAFTATVDREGRLVARAQQIAGGMWPPGLGVTTRGRTTGINPELSAGVQKLLANLGWFGVAQTQFIFTDDGPPVLIDFNGRFYGSLALALQAGPNIAAVWAAAATGRRLPPGGDARAGVSFQRLDGDLRRALREHRGNAGSLPCDLLGCLYAAKKADVHPVWQSGDLRPVLHATGSLVKEAQRSALRTLSRRFGRRGT